jgi:hypothetical protein
MPMKKILILLAFWPFIGFSQSNYVSVNESYYHLIDRYEVKSGKIFPQIFTTIKPYKRSDIVSFLDSASQEGLFTSSADKFNLEYLQNDSWEWANSETNESRKPVMSIPLILICM